MNYSLLVLAPLLAHIALYEIYKYTYIDDGKLR